MKTSRSNSFRLHRLTKTNSLRKGFEQNGGLTEDSFKLQALNSISKGVKYNDLSYITGRQLNKLRKQPPIQSDLAYQSSKNNMMDMRKKYDDIKKQCLKKEVTIFHLKEEKQRYQLKKGSFNDGKDTGKQKVQTFQNLLNQKKNLLQVTQTQKKVLLNMRLTYNTDKIFYDQRKFDLEQQLSHYKKQKKIFEREGFQFNENTDRAQKIYQKLMKQLEIQNKQRQDHLKNLEMMIQNKEGIIQQNQIRGLQIQQIAQRAMLDKNQSQKQWQKLFLTNTFVNKMLRNKIQRQMQKFSVVEFAFKQIKTQTGINDAQTLVQKYLNKQEVYGQLLGKISLNQKNIQSLRTQTQQLIAQHKRLQVQKEILQSTKIVHQDLRNGLKNLSLLQEKSKNAGLLQNKLVSEIIKQMKKINFFIDKKDKKIEIPQNKSQIVKLFKLFSSKLNQLVDQTSQLNFKQNIESYPQNIESQRVSRVIPKIVKKNSMGQENFDHDEQQTNYSNLAEQNQVVYHQREQVIKNNQKFMKQLKRKRQQMKKIIVQMMEKKTQDKTKVVQVKKEQ